MDNGEVPGGSEMAPGDSGGVSVVFRGIPGVFRWFRVGSVFYRHPTKNDQLYNQPYLTTIIKLYLIT